MTKSSRIATHDSNYTFFPNLIPEKKQARKEKECWFHFFSGKEYTWVEINLIISQRKKLPHFFRKNASLKQDDLLLFLFFLSKMQYNWIGHRCWRHHYARMLNCRHYKHSMAYPLVCLFVPGIIQIRAGMDYVSFATAGAFGKSYGKPSIGAHFTCVLPNQRELILRCGLLSNVKRSLISFFLLQGS